MTKMTSMIAQWTAAVDFLSSAIVLDALDAQGLKHQAPRISLAPLTSSDVIVGFAKCLQWADFAHNDPNTYAMELAAVDSVQTGEIIVCSTSSSVRSGIWGELLSTAALARGSRGIVTDGAVRDLAKISALGFPVFAQFVCPYDSLSRQKVIAYDVDIEIDGVTICPGDIVVADRDGVVVVPQSVEQDILLAARDKSEKEDGFRDAVRAGMSLVDAHQRFKIL